ncbi:MAG TPA: HAD hydrolase family protein [Candidatus Bathyarchaeia archaeon]|nr:HAD hydrolase family protein [Candidatus Bathyarchaeia archaeon]
MFFKALACDFDGTLAADDRIMPAARAALDEARRAGLRLVLVTGRTFFELTRVCDCLDVFDGVVAENGAVLYYPRLAMIRDQGPPPPGMLLAELEQRGIYYQAGRVIVATTRADEARVKEALAAVGVTRERAYNRAALMLLPAGVSKGTGVQHVLRFLELSPHDVLAIGDAENDLALFAACGWSGCPANGVPAVQASVDWVFPGEAGDGVAAAITGPILHDRLPVAESPRHRVSIGWVVATSEPVTIPARGINLLILGDPHSGKSWLAGGLVERLVGARYAVCVIDPEGDYRVLARLPGIERVEIHDVGEVERALESVRHDPAASIVLDLSALRHATKVAVIERALRCIRDIRQVVGRPHWVLVDEAHYSLHREGVADEALGLEHRGFCIVTYRPSWLRERVMGAVDVLVAARTTAREELDRLGEVVPPLAGASGAALETLAHLPRGEFLVRSRGAAGGGPALTFVAAPRQTVHVRHLAKYVDSRVAAGREFLFRRPDGHVVGGADSLHAFRRGVLEASSDVLAHHAAAGDFSRWVRDVFGDAELARQLHKIEARWTRSELKDLRRAVDAVITVRYGTDG